MLQGCIGRYRRLAVTYSTVGSSNRLAWSRVIKGNYNILSGHVKPYTVYRCRRQTVTRGELAAAFRRVRRWNRTVIRMIYTRWTVGWNSRSRSVESYFGVACPPRRCPPPSDLRLSLSLPPLFLLSFALAEGFAKSVKYTLRVPKFSFNSWRLFCGNLRRVDRRRPPVGEKVLSE